MGTIAKTTEPALGNIWKHVSPRLIGADGRKLMQDSTSADLKSLCHHMAWCYAQPALQNSRLRLSAVSSWSDPYEKAWVKILFNRPHSALKGAVAYGICFTTSTYDEPAWRMHGFSRPPPMVRLRLRKDDILDAVRASLTVHAGSWFLRSVRYRKTAELNALAQTVVGQQQKDVSRMAAAILLQKRKAFVFEKEVRLLLILPPGTPQDDAFFLPIATSAVTQVMSSPHATDAERHRVEGELSALGKKLTRSGVLRGPNWTLQP